MKQTLLSIKRTTNVTTRAIAEQSRLPIADVFTVETGGFCSQEMAQQVLSAFNQLSGMQIRLEDIALHHTEQYPREQPFGKPARKDAHQVAPVRVVPLKISWQNQGGRP